MLKRVMFLMFLTFMAASFATAKSPSINSGITWLIANQNGDKSWGKTSSSTTQFTATVEILDALRLNGSTGTSFDSGLNWLNAQSIVSTNFTVKRLQIRSQSAVDFSDDLNRLISFKNAIDTNWGLDDEYANDILNTALALHALKSANFTDQTDQPVIYPALSYLTSSQDSDGGWGFTEESDSNVYVTALVLSTLAQYNGAYDLQAPITTAASYLLTKQNPDGGFGGSPSTSYETALAFIALVESEQTGAQQAAPLQNAITYLAAEQQPNGSWNDDPYCTALALQALAYVKPDLAIQAEDLAASTTSPLEGEPLTLTATVRNLGLEPAANVTVELRDNAAYLGEQTVAALSPGATTEVIFTIEALAPVGGGDGRTGEYSGKV